MRGLFALGLPSYMVIGLVLILQVCYWLLLRRCWMLLWCRDHLRALMLGRVRRLWILMLILYE